MTKPILHSKASHTSEEERSYLLDVWNRLFNADAEAKRVSISTSASGNNCLIHSTFGVKQPGSNGVSYPHAREIRNELINFLENLDEAALNASPESLRRILAVGMNIEGLIEDNLDLTQVNQARLNQYVNGLKGGRFLNNADAQLLATASNTTIVIHTDLQGKKDKSAGFILVEPVEELKNLFTLPEELLPESKPDSVDIYFNPVNDNHFEAIETQTAVNPAVLRDAIIASYLQQIYDNNCGIDDNEAFDEAVAIADRVIKESENSGKKLSEIEKVAFKGTRLATATTSAPSLGG